MSHIQPDATKRTPQIKGIYIALISQSGTADPTLVVIKNTLPTTGMPVWARNSAGVYTFISAVSGYFPAGLVTTKITPQSVTKSYFINVSSTEQIAVATTTALTGVLTDAVLAFTPIEITIWDRLQD